MLNYFQSGISMLSRLRELWSICPPHPVGRVYTKHSWGDGFRWQPKLTMHWAPGWEQRAAEARVSQGRSLEGRLSFQRCVFLDKSLISSGCVGFSWTESHIAQTGLDLRSLQLLPSKFWDVDGASSGSDKFYYSPTCRSQKLTGSGGTLL